MRRSVFTLVGCVLLASVLCLSIATHSSYMQQTVLCHATRIIERMWDADIKIGRGSINFLTGVITLHDTTITPRSCTECSWHYDTCTIDYTMLSYFLHNTIGLKLAFDHMHIHSPLDETGPIVLEHFKHILNTTPTDPTILLKELAVDHLTLFIPHDGRTTVLDMEGAFSVTQHASDRSITWHTTGTLTDGALFSGQTTLLETLSGTLRIDLDQQAGKLQVTADLVGIMLGGMRARLNGEWHDATGNFALTHAPYETESEPLFSGTGTLTATKHGIRLTSTGSSTHPLFQTQKISTRVDLTQGRLQLHSILRFAHNASLRFQACYDPRTKKCAAILDNPTHILLPQAQLHIPAGKLSCKFSSSPHHPASATYSLGLMHDEFFHHFDIAGSAHTHDQVLHIEGTTSQGTFACTINLDPMRIQTMTYTVDDHRAIDLAHDAREHLVGTVAYACVQPFLPARITSHLLGTSGTLHLDLDQTNMPKLRGQLKLSDAHLYIASSINLLKECSAGIVFDAHQRKLTLDTVNIQLHKGVIRAPYVRMTWDQAFALKHLIAPYTLHETLINYHHDFYSIINGTGYLEQHTNQPLTLNGNIVMKKAHAKNGLLSPANQEHMRWTLQQSPAPLACNLHITTQQPLKAHTDFLDADARIDMTVQTDADHPLLTPSLAGTIVLDKGQLHFTNGELWISKGVLTFIPHTAGTATIDLFASNKIRNYHVRLQATGSLERPTILLESTPHLSREQIIGLLFGGSETVDLQENLPALLLQNIHKMTSVTKDLQPEASSLLEKISQSFAYLHITPQFTDQSGRGGIRGTLNIDVNEQLHARIQKNFNLQEDFAAQLEYLVNDDINIKLIRDQRGDLGAELEVRFKV